MIFVGFKRNHSVIQSTHLKIIAYLALTIAQWDKSRIPTIVHIHYALLENCREPHATKLSSFNMASALGHQHCGWQLFRSMVLLADAQSLSARLL